MATSVRLLVLGASSGIGLAVVQQALAAGHQVRAFARSAQSMTLEHESLEKVPGDALDADAVHSALQNTDAVVQTLGIPFNLRLLTGPVTLFSAATGVLLDAMEAGSCKRLLCVTGFGAGTSQQSIHPLQRLGFNTVFGRAYADKSKQEELIEGSGLDWTIVRPGVLTKGTNPRDYKALFARKDWRNGFVSRVAVASFLVQSIPDRDTYRASPVIIS